MGSVPQHDEMIVRWSMASYVGAAILAHGSLQPREGRKPDSRSDVEHYNRGRPHRALGLASPLAEASIAVTVPVSPRDVRRRDLLGGLIHEYYRVAA
jgi:hypothetical protein